MTAVGEKRIFIRALDILFQRSSVFHLVRIPTYLGTMKRIATVLDMQDGEQLLDVGCGTGMCSHLARGMYVGIDTFLPHLRFARRRSDDSSSFFVAMSVLNLGFSKGAFDKAVVVNMIHHLDGAAVERLLSQLRRIVRKRVLILEGAPEAANRVESFLLRHDRGGYIRAGAELRELVSEHYDLECEEVFHNTLHTVPQVLLSLVPKRVCS